MKRFLHAALTFLFVSTAYGQEILAPYAETPFSSGVKDRKTGETMKEGNWAFEVSVTNDNDKPLFCKSTPFLARLGLSDDFCARADFASYVYPAGEGTTFSIPAKGKIRFGEVGYDERVKKSTELDKELQFCGREAWDLNCGITCPNGKNFDETEDQVINTDGYIRRVCLRNGTLSIKEIRCDKDHVVGDTWDDPVDNGRMYFGCKQSGEISKQLQCKQSPLHLEKDGSCQPAPCNDTPNGQRFETQKVPFGKITALCYYGSSKDVKTECNADAVLENETCRPARDCDGAKHGKSKVVMPAGCTPACEKSRKTYQCTDGKLDLIKTESVLCRPAHAVCA